jgi:hypothetical protein
MQRFIIQFNGYHENGYPTDKKYEIVTITGNVTMDIIKSELVKLGKLSPFRQKKDINIFYMQAF